jgi:hypothetical protein
MGSANNRLVWIAVGCAFYLLALFAVGEGLLAAAHGDTSSPTPTPVSVRLPYDDWRPLPPALPTPTPGYRPPWQFPTPTPTPLQVYPPAPVVLTWSDDGATYGMRIGQVVSLNLGNAYVRAASSNPSVLRLEPSPLQELPVPGARPLFPNPSFRAIGVGWATITATNGYPCPPNAVCAQPAMPVRVFRVTVYVG